MVTERSHPSRERLADLAEGRLGALERSRLERHISECARCSADLTSMALPAEAPAPTRGSAELSVLGRARRLLRHPSANSAAGPASQFTGALRFDSATMAPAFGMRGTSETSDRQLLFEAGPFEVEVHTRGGRAGWNISGQVLGPTHATSGEVRLIGVRASARSHLSELLEFRFPMVPHGKYQLELRLAAEALLQIGPFELGP
jgi:anti-sigma factor RsiW